MFAFFSKYFWLLGIIMTAVNVIIMYFRAGYRISENPSLKDGYFRIIKAIMIWGNLPWVIMGLGYITGSTQYAWEYFRPREGNPFVIAFFASTLLIYALSGYWLIKKRGADFLVNHPGIFNHDMKSPNAIILFWILISSAGILAMTVFFLVDFPVMTGAL